MTEQEIRQKLQHGKEAQRLLSELVLELEKYGAPQRDIFDEFGPDTCLGQAKQYLDK